MAILGPELEKEKKILRGVNNKVAKKINELGEDINLDEEKLREFKKYTWDNRNSIDDAELAQVKAE